MQLFVNPHVVHMGPALNLTNANARKAGMVDTVTKVSNIFFYYWLD